MRICLTCDEPITGPEAFRILIGGVTYDTRNRLRFIRGVDEFRDGSKTKWLCRRCALEHDIYVDELEFDICRAVEGQTPCNEPFEPLDGIGEPSECVLRIEWGKFVFNEGGKGADVGFEPLKPKEVNCGHVHYNCAESAWGLPLYSIPPPESP